MARATIGRLRHLIRTLAHVVTARPAEELDDDDLSILDLENIVLAGEITQHQRDPHAREVKHVVQGVTLDGAVAEAVVKLGPTGRLVVITVYLC